MFVSSGEVRSLTRHQLAFGNDAIVPFRRVLYAVTRLILIVGRRHEVANQVITCNSVTATTWGEMDCLTDGEFVRQIYLPRLVVIKAPFPTYAIVRKFDFH